MKYTKPMFVTGISLLILTLLPTFSLAAQVEVVGSIQMKELAADYLILNNGRGSAQVSCDANADGVFEIRIVSERSDEYDAGSVVHVARRFASSQECNRYKSSLLTASPRHPIKLQVAAAALQNNG